LFRNRLVEISQVLYDQPGIKITHAFAPGTCLCTGDAQQSVKDLDQPFGLIERLSEGGAILVRAFGRA